LGTGLSVAASEKIVTFPEGHVRGRSEEITGGGEKRLEEGVFSFFLDGGGKVGVSVKGQQLSRKSPADCDDASKKDIGWSVFGRGLQESQDQAGKGKLLEDTTGTEDLGQVVTRRTSSGPARCLGGGVLDK